MKIIGFHWDHHSSAALLEHGTVTACVSEERYSGLKNDSRFPVNAAQYCIDVAGGSDRIDAVAIATINKNYDFYLLNVHNNFTSSDFVREQHKFWKPRFYGGGDLLKMRDLFPRYVDRAQYPQSYWSISDQDDMRDQTFPKDSERLVADFFKLSPEKVKRFDHHWCHARYSFHASPFHEGPVLVLTVDGSGDGANATVGIKDGPSFKRVYSTLDCTIGRYYRHITMALGMKPLEHEYKLMGLAPYASQARETKRVSDILHTTLQVVDTQFVPGPKKPADSYFSFLELFEGIRFDYIAAGLQNWAEELLTEWVRNLVKRFGIDTVVIGGGVSMNVKAMGRIGQLPDVRHFFVAGSSSDESNAIGAALCWADDHGVPPGRAVKTFYLGPDAGCNSNIPLRALREGHQIIENPSPSQIAEILVAGVIIGRCVGRMEFGQRALGNRSILADPIDANVVPRINAMIKSRDFWMPFAPVILDGYEQKYLLNRNGVKSPHMSIAYETTEEGFLALRAACHPADRTARAQILCRDDNPDLYGLLEAFEKRSGRGGLLNTSFNLHGHPIVRNSDQAFAVFSKTDLDALLLPGYLIVKQKAWTSLNLKPFATAKKSLNNE